MFKIESGKNEISSLDVKSFAELGFKERQHLQEWIAKLPSCLGEELLIIQKEFSGFSDTNERLDLLAIDKLGSLVIIENKLDDTGRDVTWQALKYASYCSGLSKENIRKIFQDYLLKSGSSERAEDLLAEFLEAADYQDISLNKGVTQRIILIAANFRKEVTSTVLWLLNFKLRVQCFKVTPYSMGTELFLNIEQIIPTKDAEEFMIGLAEKAQDEVAGISQEKSRHTFQRAFWIEVIGAMATKSSLFQNISPGTSGWIGAGSGMRGVAFNFVGGKAGGRTEVYIDRGDHDENKSVFDQLQLHREQIDAEVGGQLVWDRLNNRRACRIKLEVDGNIFDKEQWPNMIEHMTDAMVGFERAFRKPIDEINLEMKRK